jgi:hypothetical protein
MVLLTRALTVALLMAVSHLPAEVRGQDAKKDAARQRAAAEANLKKAGFARTTVVESKHFIVATTLPEPRARALGAAFDRIAPIARKALKLDEMDAPWKGKLAVYYLPDGADFNAFIRAVVVSQPEGIHYSLRSDEPFLVDPAESPAKSTEADQLSRSSAIVAGAFLRARASGAAVPEWLAAGFGRVTAMRAEGGTARRLLAYRSAARALANKGARPTDLWSESPPAGAEVLANSLADYLAYGPGSSSFPKLLRGLSPDENGNQPNIAAAFEAAGWKDLAMLEAAWRKWAATAR